MEQSAIDPTLVACRDLDGRNIDDHVTVERPASDVNDLFRTINLGRSA